MTLLIPVRKFDPKTMFREIITLPDGEQEVLVWDKEDLIEFRTVPIDEIDPPRKPLRKKLEGIEGLAQSIRTVGLRVPIHLLEKGSGRYEIGEHGHRRFEAAKLAGLNEVPAVITPEGLLTEADLLKRRLVENVCRVDLDPITISDGICELREGENMTLREIGQLMDRSEAWASNHERLQRLPEEIKEALRSGSLHLRHGLELLRVSGDAQGYFSRLAIERGWSVQRLKMEVDQYLKDPEEGKARLRALLDLKVLEGAGQPEAKYEGSIKPREGFLRLPITKEQAEKLKAWDTDLETVLTELVKDICQNPDLREVLERELATLLWS